MKSILNNMSKNLYNSIQFNSIQWSGSKKNFIDEIDILNFSDIKIGRYGGSSISNASYNEDGYFIASSINNLWKFVVLLDAHNTDESTQLVIATIHENFYRIAEILDKNDKDLFQSMQLFITELFSSVDFRNNSKKINGETACLICLQINNVIWWFSIGDNLALLFHDELAELGQYSLNQRHFFEWIGNKSFYYCGIPCHSSGMRELRKGINKIYLITDGVIESGNREFENLSILYQELNKEDHKAGILNVLNIVKNNNGKDSATIISWNIENKKNGIFPSK